MQTLLVSCSAFVLARLVGTASRWIVPGAIIAIAALVAAVSSNDLLSGSPHSGPFGYANATGAFFALVVVAGLMLAARSEGSPASRLLGISAAIGFATVPFATGSLAASGMITLAPVALLALLGRPWARDVIVGCAVLLGVVLAATIVLGASYRPGPAGSRGVADELLSQRRQALWHDALQIMAEHPLIGVGPDRFRLVSPTASSDPDTREAHNEFLQQGAETGIPGLLLLGSLFGWVFIRARARRRPDALTALGVFAIAALGVMGSVDYVMQFPAIPAVASALAGVGMVRVRRAETS